MLLHANTGVVIRTVIIISRVRMESSSINGVSWKEVLWIFYPTYCVFFVRESSNKFHAEQSLRLLATSLQWHQLNLTNPQKVISCIAENHYDEGLKKFFGDLDHGSS